MIASIIFLQFKNDEMDKTQDVYANDKIYS